MINTNDRYKDDLDEKLTRCLWLIEDVCSLLKFYLFQWHRQWTEWDGSLPRHAWPPIIWLWTQVHSWSEKEKVDLNFVSKVLAWSPTTTGARLVLNWGKMLRLWSNQEWWVQSSCFFENQLILDCRWFLWSRWWQCLRAGQVRGS